MAHYRSDFDLAAPIDDVFACLSDVEGWQDWDPSIRETTPTDTGSPAIGSRYEVVVGFYGKAIRQVHQIVELEAPSRLVVATSGRVVGRTVYELTPIDGGTRVIWDASLKLKGMARMLDRGLNLAFSGLGDSATEGLRKRFG